MAEEEVWTVSIKWSLHHVYCRDAPGDDLSVLYGITQKAFPRKRNSVSNAHSMNLLPLARHLE